MDLVVVLAAWAVAVEAGRAVAVVAAPAAEGAGPVAVLEAATSPQSVITSLFRSTFKIF